MAPAQDPKLKKQNEKHLQQCVDILQNVEGYLGERAEDKFLEEKS